MRLLVGKLHGQQSVFKVHGDQATNLSALLPDVGSDLLALASSAELRAQAEQISGGEQVPVSSIEAALPVERPGKFICLGLNYVEHAKEGGQEVPDYPALFVRNHRSMVASGAPMVVPACSHKLDYEAELLVIIGSGGRHIKEADALDHVFGYTVFNDGSVRDYQRRTHQWTPGKNFDSTGAVGAIVVTADELPAGASGLKIESRIGSETMQSSNTSNMIWSVAQAIATIAEFTTLEPGDHIAMGTPPGVGFARKPQPRWLRPGEVVEVEIEAIGICSNPVVSEAAP